MLVGILTKISVSAFVGYLKGKRSFLMIFDKHANQKYRNVNRKFWCKGFYLDKFERNGNVIFSWIIT